MRLFIIVLSIIIFCSAAQAKDLQLLNPDFLGKPTTNAIKALFDKKSDEIGPYMVTMDMKCGNHSAASVFYSKRVSFAEARESLNKLYGDYEIRSLLREPIEAHWRVEDKRFAIHLVQEEDRMRIMYLKFQPVRDVMVSTVKSMVGNVEILDDSECKE